MPYIYSTIVESVAALQELNARIMATSCSSYCAATGSGDGVVIGTAPFCSADCSSDCDNTCVTATKRWGDYGSGCWSGKKVCCCAQ